MSNIFSLINLDEEFYRINNKDLKNLSTFDLKNHYFNFGYFEGRPSSKIAIKENFIKTGSYLTGIVKQDMDYCVKIEKEFQK